MEESVISRLTSGNDKHACALADKIIAESTETDLWYEYFDDFASLLSHTRSYVRNRAMYILAANAKWNDENSFAAILPEFFSHITDEKPVTARQCIKALAQIGQALHNAELSGHKESMRHLIERDITETEKTLKNFCQ